MFDWVDRWSWTTAVELQTLAAASALWCVLHLVSAEWDTKIIKKLAPADKPKQGHSFFTLMYYALSTVTYIAQIYLYMRVYRSSGAHEGGTWPKHFPSFLQGLKPGMRAYIAVGTSMMRFASLWLLAFANFTSTTPPTGSVVLKHDGFHSVLRGMPSNVRAGEELPAYGLGRITRHPISTALAFFALSHLTPTDTPSKWFASIAFWAPQLILAVVGMVMHDRRLGRDGSGTFKRYLRESPAIFNPFALPGMPMDEFKALLQPAAFASAITAAFFFVPKLNRLLYAPESSLLPMVYMVCEALHSSPAFNSLLPVKEGTKVVEGEGAVGAQGVTATGVPTGKERHG